VEVKLLYDDKEIEDLNEEVTKGSETIDSKVKRIIINTDANKAE